MIKLRAHLTLCAVLASAALASAQESQSVAAQSPTSAPSPAGASVSQLDDKQKLSPGDSVSYRVAEDREDPKALIVTDSGELEIPYIGRHKVQDKTCQQVASEVTALLERDYYHRATVSISVNALMKSRGVVYVYGAVRNPVPINLPPEKGLTVSKVILLAGGFGDFANDRKVTLTRKADDGSGANHLYEINVGDILKKGRTDQDLPVQADDMIFVPTKAVNF